MPPDVAGAAPGVPGAFMKGTGAAFDGAKIDRGGPVAAELGGTSKVPSLGVGRTNPGGTRPRNGALTVGPPRDWATTAAAAASGEL